jgi:2'-5' RNA ligase
VNEELLDDIKRNLSMAADSSPAFNLSAGDLGFFPNKNRPRVIWMGIKGEVSKAELLAKRVDDCLLSAGFQKEKNHRFHLTLGRFRSDSNIHSLQRKAEELMEREKFISFKVDKFHLMMSTLSSQGPEYLILDTFTLNG